jgi:hypothetical protein
MKRPALMNLTACQSGSLLVSRLQPRHIGGHVARPVLRDLLLQRLRLAALVHEHVVRGRVAGRTVPELCAVPVAEGVEEAHGIFKY